MATIKNVNVRDDIHSTYYTHPIGIEAQNVIVSYDTNGNIIENISAVTPSYTKTLVEAIEDFGDSDAKADKNHASTTTTYGKATNSLYGHIKLGDGLENGVNGETKVAYGDSADSACEGNDARLTNDRKSPAAITFSNGAPTPVTKVYDGSVAQTVNYEDIGGCPVSHTNTTSEYGLGTPSLYGHFKVIDVDASASSVTGDTSAAASARSFYDGLNGRGNGFSYDATTQELKLLSDSTVLSSTVIDSSSGKSSLIVITDDDSLIGQTMTCSVPGGEVLTNTVYSSLIVTFALAYTGTYTISCGGYSTTCNISTVGGIYNASLHVPKCTLTINTTTTSWLSNEFVVTKNGTEVARDNLANGTYVLKLYETGTYTVSLGGKSSNVTFNTLDTSQSVTINDLDIVTFHDGTDEEIAAMLAAYYNDEITLAEMGWGVGDTRTLHLNAMQAPNPNSSQTWVAQDITLVIVATEQTDLATPINGHTKACITVQTREALSGTVAGTLGAIYVNGDSATDTTFTKWSNLYMRTYINNTIFGAISNGSFKSAIKPSVHYRHTNYNTADAEQVTDTLFLPSYPEVFGTASYSNYTPTSSVEGTQFSYYTTTANRVKYCNNNGVPTTSTQNWWGGSASSYYNSSNGYSWCVVFTDGSAASYYGNFAYGLAPAFAM